MSEIKKKSGRPKKVIDYETVKKLASIMCTQEEIATLLELSVRTLQRDNKFCRIYKTGMENGKMSIRRCQFESAVKKGSVPMQIWLGKQYLNQRDNFVADVGISKVDELLKGIEKSAKS